MIQFSCSACKKSFNVPDQAGGRGTNCPHCGLRLLIPVAGVQQATVKPPLPPEPTKKLAKPPIPPVRIESAGVSKQAPAAAFADQEKGWHPALWGLIGGIGVVLAALVIALVIPRGAKPSAGDLHQNQEPARHVIAQADSEPKSKEAPGAKAPLSAEALFTQASPGVVTITCKNDFGKTIASGSGFFVKEELVHDPDKDKLGSIAESASKIEGRHVEYAYLLTNYHVIEAAVEADIVLSDKSQAYIGKVLAEDQSSDLALLFVQVFSPTPPHATPVGK